jgi:hypothetical protein
MSPGCFIVLYADFPPASAEADSPFKAPAVSHNWSRVETRLAALFGSGNTRVHSPLMTRLSGEPSIGGPAATNASSGCGSDRAHPYGRELRQFFHSISPPLQECREGELQKSLNPIDPVHRRRRHCSSFSIYGHFPKLDLADSTPVSRSNNLFHVWLLGAIIQLPFSRRDSGRLQSSNRFYFPSATGGRSP